MKEVNKIINKIVTRENLKKLPWIATVALTAAVAWNVKDARISFDRPADCAPENSGMEFKAETDNFLLEVSRCDYGDGSMARLWVGNDASHIFMETDN